MAEAVNDPGVAARQRAMAILARAGADELAAALADAVPALPAHRRLRGPEAGLLMARGRAGGGGAAFNLGEVPVTRCTVRLAGGEVGHAYVMGRDVSGADGRRAELAALADAMIAADPGLAGRILPPLAARQAAARATVAARAAATRVQFFTLATMRS